MVKSVEIIYFPPFLSSAAHLPFYLFALFPLPSARCVPLNRLSVQTWVWLLQISSSSIESIVRAIVKTQHHNNINCKNTILMVRLGFYLHCLCVAGKMRKSLFHAHSIGKIRFAFFVCALFRKRKRAMRNRRKPETAFLDYTNIKKMNKKNISVQMLVGSFVVHSLNSFIFIVLLYLFSPVVSSFFRFSSFVYSWKSEGIFCFSLQKLCSNKK